MEELKLYDIDSAELNELIDSKRIELKKKNLEYKKLTEKVSEIIENNPNILELIEDNEVEHLSKEECLLLQKLIKLNLKMTTYEDREIFFLGARENYFYFKNLGLIKE
ncbi:MAG: hypothetical protein ILA02_03065 [Clostridia bacterium]|nr:hypothetical protein [Clostridia bacterium]